MVGTVLQMWLLANRHRSGFYVSLVNQVPWTLLNIATGAYGLMILLPVMVYLNITGLRQWAKPDPKIGALQKLRANMTYFQGKGFDQYGWSCCLEKLEGIIYDALNGESTRDKNLEPNWELIRVRDEITDFLELEGLMPGKRALKRWRRVINDTLD